VTSQFVNSEIASREPLRVAHVVGKMLGGGVESVVMNYYRNIDREKIQFDFIVDADSMLIPEQEICELGGRVFKVPPYQHPLAYSNKLQALFSQQNWPIVHSHINSLSIFPLRAAKHSGVPVRIAHSHSTAGPGEPAKNAMKNVLRKFSKVYPTHKFACSEHAGKWLFGKSSDFIVIPNAIELDKFNFSETVRAEVRQELGVHDGQLVVGHVGRFMPQKNHRFLIDVFCEVLKRRSDAVLVLVGEGDLKELVQQQIDSVGILNHVMFLGYRSDTYRLYQAFDVFALPSLYEGLGMVAIEAQAAGLPCVVSNKVPDETDISNLIKHLSLRDPEEWANEIVFLSELKREPYCETSVSTKDNKYASYQINKAAKNLENLYLDIIKNCPY
jgi:glycosyltransferase EpsF